MKFRQQPDSELKSGENSALPHSPTHNLELAYCLTTALYGCREGTTSKALTSTIGSRQARTTASYPSLLPGKTEGHIKN